MQRETYSVDQEISFSSDDLHLEEPELVIDGVEFVHDRSKSRVFLQRLNRTRDHNSVSALFSYPRSTLELKRTSEEARRRERGQKRARRAQTHVQNDLPNLVLVRQVVVLQVHVSCAETPRYQYLFLLASNSNELTHPDGPQK